MAAGSELMARRSRLDAAFARVKALTSQDNEVQSDFARYLCVLVSGFVETAVSELAAQYCTSRSGPQVSNYARSQLAKLQNVKTERLLQFVGAFDATWRTELESFMDGARKDALDSVVDLRNKIAHGESVGVTYTRISNYYSQIKQAIDFLENRFS